MGHLQFSVKCFKNIVGQPVMDLINFMFFLNSRETQFYNLVLEPSDESSPHWVMFFNMILMELI